MNRLTASVVLISLAALDAGCGGAPDDDIEAVSSALYSGLGFCPPFDDFSVCLCSDSNLMGYCQIYRLHDPFSPQSALESGFYPNPQSFAPFPNDGLSSFAMGAYTAFEPYVDAGYYQSAIIFVKAQLIYVPNRLPGQTPTGINFDTSMNDETSSFRLYRTADLQNCGAGTVAPGKVALFNDANYKGECAVLTPGDYPNPGWAPGASGTQGNLGMHDNWVSSVRIGAGVHARLWRDPGVLQNGQATFIGPSVDVTTDVANLGPGYNFNDQLSAIQVFAP